GSMDYKFGLVRAAAASFLEHIGEEDQVAVYGFNTKIRLYQDFSDSRDISDYIWDAKAEDATRLYDCMDTALDALAKRPERRRAELVITDGCDNLSKATLDSVLRKALSQAVTIYTVDLTDDDLILGTTSAANDLRRGRRDLEEMARRSGGVYIHSPKGDKLEESFTSVVDELRNQYTLTYYSTGQKRDGRWRKLDVAVSRPGITVRTRQGYYAPKGAS
ncbi:MAG TPA: VWA domain-containing protein, partial [Blastocatellia bacterium]|nr:VWA domain-containing protein [Blastocatellia bacterium]